MGKIYKNGILFAGSTDNASAISFNNADTGIEAANVQGAIEEIKRKNDIDKSSIDNSINEINNNLDKKQNIITGAATTIIEKNLDSNKVMGTNTKGKVAATSIAINDLSKTMRGEFVDMPPLEGEAFGLPNGYYYIFSIGNLYEQGVQFAMCYFGGGAGKIYIRTWANSIVTAGWREI